MGSTLVIRASPLALETNYFRPMAKKKTLDWPHAPATESKDHDDHGWFDRRPLEGEETRQGFDGTNEQPHGLRMFEQAAFELR